MKCPFSRTKMRITNTAIEYDSEGNQTGYNENKTETEVFTDCLMKDCAYWRFGRCRRKA
jgi:hypothetical protein